MANVLMVPASGSIIFDSQAAQSSIISPLSAAPRLSYDNAGGLNITSYTTATSALDRFSVDGASGRLFSVSDSLTGIIFSVNDASGLPVIEVESNLTDKITIGAYGSNALVVNDTKVGIGTATPNERLAVIGAISSTNIIYASGGNSNLWNSTYNTVSSLSANWSNAYTTVNSISANGATTYTTVNANSANWGSAYTNINASSARFNTITNAFTATSGTFLTGINGGGLQGTISIINGDFPGGTSGTSLNNLGPTGDPTFRNLTVTGNLSVTGDLTFLNTNVSVTSALSVVNAGTGPALYIKQSGNTPIAYFLDADGTGDIIFENNGFVGLGTASPNNRLTVVGVISSTNIIYAAAGNSDLWNSTYTSVNANSANGATTYTTVNANSANWSSVYSTVCAASANYILDGGNNKGANITIGTNDNFNLNLETANTTRMTVTSAGNIGIGTTNPPSFYNLTIQNADTSAYSSLAILKHSNSNTNGRSALTFGGDFGNSFRISQNGYTTTGENTPNHAAFLELYNQNGMFIGTGQAPNLYAQFTTAQEKRFSIYSALNSSLTNYERLSFKPQLTGSFLIMSEALGTGAYRNIEIQNGGSTRMTITSAGDVGIGTTTPAYKFDVTGSARINGINSVGLTLNKQASSFDNALYFTELGVIKGSIQNNSSGNFVIGGTDSAITQLGAGNSGTLALVAGGSGTITVSIGGSESMRFLSNGNVGIGTTTPSAKLDVRNAYGLPSSTNGTIRILSTDAAGTAGVGATLSLGGNAANASRNAVTLLGANESTSGDRGYLGVFTNGTGLSNAYGERLRVDSNGSIIINPVNNNTVSTKGLIIRASSGQTGNLTEWQDSSNVGIGAVSSAGNFGIGIVAPTSKLHIVGNVTIGTGVLDLDAGYSIRWGGAASGIYSGSGTSDMVVTVGSAERLRINGSTGNVGIGVTSPGAKLTVSGTISSNNVIDAVGGNSNLWNSTYATVNANSASWSSVYSTVSSLSANYILDGGNTKGANLIIGTNDAYAVSLETNGTTRMSISANGLVSIDSIPVSRGSGSNNTNNIAIGGGLTYNTTGVFNTSLGRNALSANTTGNYNVGLGLLSLQYNKTGERNTAVGSATLQLNSTGGNNTSVGNGSLQLLTGSLGNNSANTAVGQAAMGPLDSGSNNIAIGRLAGYTTGADDGDGGFLTNTVCDNSIFIGADTGPLNNSDTNEIVIGYGILGTGSNTTTINNGEATMTTIRGAAGHVLMVEGDIELPDTYGVILVSPDLTRWKITVNDDGSLQTTAL